MYVESKVNFLAFLPPCWWTQQFWQSRRPPFQASTLLKEFWIDKLLQTGRFLIAFCFPVYLLCSCLYCVVQLQSHSALPCSSLTVLNGVYFPWLTTFSTKTLARRQFLSLHLVPVLVLLWSAFFLCWSVLGFDQFLTDLPGKACNREV